MDKKGNTDIPSKGKIIRAWILLIILSASLAGLIYEKKNYKPQEKETNIEPQQEKLPDSVVAILNIIVENYNTNPTTIEYRAKNINTEAKFQDRYIVINYRDSANNTEIKYEYDPMRHTLSSKLGDNNKGVFDNIFKILVMSCQKRLENESDISDYLDKFFAGEEVKGLSNKDDTYEIDIVVKIGENTTNDITSNDNTSEINEETSNVESSNINT